MVPQLIWLSMICSFIADAQNIKWHLKPGFPSELYVPDTIKVCMTGDIMMHSRQMEYDFRSYFTKMEEWFKDSDITIANMEFTLAGEPYTGYPRFSAPDSFAQYLADNGVDIFLCANNHILDKGSEGAARTLQQYRSLSETAGIRFTGAAGSMEELDSTTPLILRCGEISVALINFTYGTNLGSTEQWPRVNYMGQKEFLCKALHKADSLADFTIVLPHWGNEYQLIHSEDQERTAEWLADNGADLIVGTHPHVIQDISTVNGVPVAYSLGNAVSNMSAPDTQLGLTLVATLVREINGVVRLAAIEPIYTWCSRPGGYSDSYIVIPVEEYKGKKSEWNGPWEYEKMISTYERVRHIHNNEQ